MDTYLVETFLWENDGLTVKRKKFDNGREAMDYAYSQKWSIMKIYINGVLMHENSVSEEMEQYA